MVDHPKRPFNAATDHRSKQETELNNEGDIRDKDNAMPRVKPPSFAKRPAPNLAPVGMAGIKTNNQLPTRYPAERPPEPEINIIKGDPDKDLYISGKITTMPGYSFTAKVHDLPSSFGIEDGKISKLEVQKHGETILRYDRGWDIKPRGDENRQALQKIRDVLDKPDRKFEPIIPKSPDKDLGHSR